MEGRSEIIEQIRTAFAGIKLDGGTSLEQTRVIDNYGRDCTAEQFEALPLSERVDDWTQIPTEALDEADSLAHLDALGFRYYIPALMIRMLDNYDPLSMMTIGTISGLSASSDHYKQQYRELTQPQCVAIARYLEILPAAVDLDTEDRTIVERASRNYWSNFLKKS